MIGDKDKLDAYPIPDLPAFTDSRAEYPAPTHPALDRFLREQEEEEHRKNNPPVAPPW